MYHLPSLASATFIIVGLATAPAAANDRAACGAGRGDEAIAACGRVIASSKRGPRDLALAYRHRCAARNSKRDYERALGDCNEALRLDPKLTAAYAMRCWVRNNRREPDQALADCNDALRLNPKLPAAYNNRGHVWLAKGETDRAIADFSEAIRLAPRNAIGYLNRCAALNGRQEFDRALIDCDAAIRLDPSSVAAHNNRCQVWNSKKEPDRAIADCGQAIRLDPAAANSYGNRANAWRAKGELDRAIADYSEAIRIEPKRVRTLSNRGLLYESMGQFDKALADFRAVLALDPQYPSAGERVRRAEQRLAAPADPRTDAAAPPPPTAHVQPAAEPSGSAVARAGAGTEKRVALVIGNSAYANAGVLPNARNDAQKLAETLKRIGFSAVTLDLDLPRDRLVDSLKTFAAEADRAHWAVVYFAGHGIEFGGTNYLVPTDARLSSDRDISFEAIALDQVLLAVEGARKLRLIVLDACRDNPFARSMKRSTATRSVGRGLARIEPEGATLVAFAAKDGQVAQDGDGANSPFVTALVKHIEMPGLEINFVFRKVRDEVLQTTGRRQEPFVYGSLPAEPFYFRARQVE